jgi:hypothetical protein
VATTTPTKAATSSAPLAIRIRSKPRRDTC